jgi:hypothetical protein
MATVCPEPVEGLCFDRLRANEFANKSGRINKNEYFCLLAAKDQERH